MHNFDIVSRSIRTSDGKIAKGDYIAKPQKDTQIIWLFKAKSWKPGMFYSASAIQTEIQTIQEQEKGDSTGYVSWPPPHHSWTELLQCFLQGFKTLWLL